jgi:hypothetical protein
VPKTQYLLIDGHGDPNRSDAFSAAVSALYPIEYKIEFASKAALSRNSVVTPLEGLWWAEDMTTFATDAESQSGTGR